MSTSNLSFSNSIKKNVLQQSNCNLDVTYKKEDTYKVLITPKSKEDMTLETENQCNPPKTEVEKSVRSEAKRLRSIRLDLSSLKRSVIQKSKTDLKLEMSSDESSEEELKKNQRKMRPLVPNYVTNSDSGPCRKPRQNRQDSMMLSSQNSTKVGKPQPLSIARRNARERNRVKQVNEGFATLRSRIPDYISEAYNEEKGRKSAKKLSKVETLRMAVDYIRHLETLLDLKSTEGDEWVKEIKTESQPWDTPNSSVGYPSPAESKYQAPSPGPFYDQAFEYQDRIFYDYDLDFISRKDVQEKRLPTLITLQRSESENQSVDDFKYYETFNRLKKETVSDENLEESQDLENLEIAEKERDVLMLPKSKDVIEKADKKTVALPPITESFSKNITAFF